MVRLFRGARGRGRGMPRPPLMMPRPMRPLEYKPDFVPPYPVGPLRGRLLRGHPVRHGPPRPHLPLPPTPPPPRMGPPRPLARPLPPPVHPPLPPRRLPLPLLEPLHPMEMSRRPHPLDLPVRPLRMPPPPMGPPLRRPLRPGPPLLRGRGLLHRGLPVGRGVSVKRLGVVANGRAKKAQKRKEKTEGEFYCETCDRSWKTLEKLEAHQAEHQVCGREGCTFTAHPKLILKHVQLHHDSGLFRRIVSTGEDVAKWIAERKNRYPTKENVEKKEAQAREMQKRGERIPTRGRPFQSRGGFRSWQERRRTENVVKPEAGSRQRKLHQKNKITSTDKWRDPEAWRGDLPQFPGTAAFPCEADDKDKVEEKHFSDDEEWVNTNTHVIKDTPKPFLSNVLASLVTNYGSDMTDDDDDNDKMSQKVGVAVLTSEKNNSEEYPPQMLKENSSSIEVNNDRNKLTSCANQEDSDSGPEECAIDRKDKLNLPIPSVEKECEAKVNKTKTEQSGDLHIARPRVPVRPPMRRHQLSLLEKLLKNEIRQERNAILQCVRYIVKNNFFACENENKTC